MIRVLVAEDEGALREAICDLVRTEEDMEVVGAAASAEEAIAVAEATSPDVAILDVRMPGGGAAAASGISERLPDTRILALSAYEEKTPVLEMLRAGAVGYLVKGIAPGEVVEAVRRAHRGQASLSIEMITAAIGALTTDVAEMREAEDVHRLSEERFRAFIESAPDSLVIVDDGGTIVLVNRQTEAMFGYSREELVGKRIEVLLPERFRKRHRGHRAGYFSDPRTRPMGAHLELAGLRKNGSEFPVDISLSAIDTEEGPLATAFIRDITERTAEEDVRRKSDDRFKALLQSAPDAVLIADSEGRIVLVNDQAQALFGYGREELLGQPLEGLLPESHLARDLRHRAENLADPWTRPMGVRLELSARRKDGTEFPVDVSLSAIDTDEGRMLTAFVRDISGRRQGEIAFRQLAAIVESSDDAIIGKTLDGTIMTWNRGAERIYGYTAEEVIGRSVTILIPVDHPDELPGVMEQLRRGEEIEPYETTRVRKGGGRIVVSLRHSAIRDASGALVGASTIARDVSQLKAQADLEREHAERRALLAHLVAAGEAERTRIAEDIHDDSIQAITAAGMRLQILRKSIEDPKQLELLSELEGTIKLSIGRLRNLLFELRPPALDHEGLSAALEMYLREAETQSDTRYRLTDSMSTQPALEARTILYRIVQEALTNIRKHALAQAATVELKEREGGYLVRVKDDGVGFAADELQNTPGHLGLASMRERAMLAGGWLTVDSAPGSGTTVEVWIPALQEPEQVVDPAEAA